MSTFSPCRAPLVLLGALIGLLVAPACPGGRAEAGFEVGNLGSNNSFNSLSGFNLTGPLFFTGQGYVAAVRFTVSSPTAVTFDSAELGLTYRSGTNALNVSLMTDGGGVPSGTSLETMQLTNIAAGPHLVTATSTAHSVLAAGVSYWLVATYGAGDTNIGWLSNLTKQVGNSAYRPDSASAIGSWVPDSTDADPSFAVFGTELGANGIGTVDAPSSGSLAVIGCLWMLGGHLVRQKHATSRSLAR